MVEHCNDSNVFIEYSNTMRDVYNNISNYNPNRNLKTLIVFDDMIVNMNTNERFQSIAKKLFIRRRKLNIFLVFITQSHSHVPKDITLDSTHYLLMKIYKKRELQSITVNHSENYRKCKSKPYSFLTIDTTLSTDDLLRFWKNLLDSL